MTTIRIADQGLRRASQALADAPRVTRSQVEQLIRTAQDGGRVSSAERKDLAAILGMLQDRMTADARQTLQQFLGMEQSAVPAVQGPASGLGPVQLQMQQLQGNVSDTSVQTQTPVTPAPTHAMAATPSLPPPGPVGTGYLEPRTVSEHAMWGRTAGLHVGDSSLKDAVTMDVEGLRYLGRGAPAG